MPYTLFMYPMMLIPGLLYIKSSQRLSIILASTLTLILLVDIVDSGIIQPTLYSILFICFSGVILNYRNDLTILSLLVAFAVSSWILSALYLINYDSFITDYNIYDGMVRSGWTDPNYYSSLISLGIISTLIIALKIKSSKYKLFLVVAAIFAIIAQLILASRGGLLSTLGSIFVLLLFSKIKTYLKLFAVLVFFILFAFLYYEGILDLIIYRIVNDSSGGSGRLDIWHEKFYQFSTQANFVQWLFGLGNNSAFTLEVSGRPHSGFGFHNDYLAIFCSYGIVGISFFIYCLIYPICIANKKDKPLICSLACCLALIATTLEPIFHGQLEFIVFLYLIYLFGKNSKYKNL